jgi:signal transduction histidine kinase
VAVAWAGALTAAVPGAHKPETARDLHEAGEPVRPIPEEQAALRRVATLVARGASPERVFAAVTAEVGRLLDGEVSVMSRYDGDAAATVVAAWTRSGTASPLPVGSRFELGGRDLHTLVFQTRRPARIDDFAGASTAAVAISREGGVQSGVGVPISVEGQLWGVIGTTSTQERPLPADSEAQLEGFTELVAAAIASAQARVELRGYAEEQAALRRVATLVARAAPPLEVFAAVAEETGRLLAVDCTILVRYDPPDLEIAGTWTRTGAPAPTPVGGRLPLGGRNVTTLVWQTARPARVDYDDAISGVIGRVAAGDWGLSSSVGVPVSTEGQLWGAIVVAFTGGEILPADTESRLAGFTELVATAIANAEAQAEVTASRARVVAAADQARRRIERDLHDGTQQRLVSLALKLRAAQTAVPPELRGQLDEAVADATGALAELTEIARGIHPAVLAERGLAPALKTLARRSPIPVDLHVRADERLPEEVEVSAYYVVAEALTNAAKHSGASAVSVEVEVAGEVLRVAVRDDGAGGVGLARGTGLAGLKDRVEALGGRIFLHSRPGAGTSLQAEFPLTATNGGLTSR